MCMQGRIRGLLRTFLAVTAAFLLASCAGKPLVPYTTDSAPLVLMPADQAGIRDARGRFREIACAVLEEHGKDLPHYRDCSDALVTVGEEPPGTGAPVDLGQARRHLVAAVVPGIGWECFQGWLNYNHDFSIHIRSFGYDSFMVEVDGLSSSEHNARQIRDAIMARAADLEAASLVLIGYSKGVPDLLEALVGYPEIRPYVAAMVSVAGAVGGSPLAYQASDSMLGLLQYFPDSECSAGDGKGLESLRPSVRQAWLHSHALPGGIRYYSAVTYPLPDQISSVLAPSHNELSRVDPRNDGQLIFYDQIIPGSTLVGYLNADHWAAGVPIEEGHPFIGRHFADRNGYPRQAMAEALMRFIEEDLDRP